MKTTEEILKLTWESNVFNAVNKYQFETIETETNRELLNKKWFSEEEIRRAINKGDKRCVHIKLFLRELGLKT